MTTPQDDRKIVKLVQANSKTTARKVKEQLQLNVKLENVWKTLHKANFFGQVARNKPYINKVNQKRLNFAQNFVNY